MKLFLCQVLLVLEQPRKTLEAKCCVYLVWQCGTLHSSTCLCLFILVEMHIPSDGSLFYLRAALLTVSICMFLPILVKWESCTSCVTVCAKCRLERKAPVLLQKKSCSKRSCVMLFVCSFMHIYSYQKCPCYVYIHLHSKNIDHFSHCLKIHCRIWNFWLYPITYISASSRSSREGMKELISIFLLAEVSGLPSLDCMS